MHEFAAILQPTYRICGTAIAKNCCQTRTGAGSTCRSVLPCSAPRAAAARHRRVTSNASCGRCRLPLLLAAAVDVDAVSMDGEAAAVQGQSAAAAPPPRMNPRHNNPKDWAAQAGIAAALGALEREERPK